MSSVAVSQPEPNYCGARGKSLFVVLLVLSILVGLGALRYFLQATFYNDEVEHAHVVWAFNQGILPYEGIHQNHTPALWVIAAPLLARLPEHALSMLVLRIFPLAACAGLCITGLFLLRELIGPLDRVRGLVMLLLLLSILMDFEFQRFRPDPLMALLVGLAILAAARLRRAPALYSLLSGIALGLAASFSPKMAPVCLLVPILCLQACYRARTLRPLWLVFPNAAGFFLGVLPMVAWLFYYGIFEGFWRSVVSNNCHAFNVSMEMLRALGFTGLITTLAIVGGLLATAVRSNGPRPSWTPASAVVVGALLAWPIMLLEPNHYAYNLQAFAMPAAVLASIAVIRLAESGAWPWWRQVAIVSVLLVFATERSIVRSVGLVQGGVRIQMLDMQFLIDACKAKDATCVGFAPWHPVFCRDATDVYLNWDLQPILVPWHSDTSKQVFRDLWSRAIAQIEKNRPVLIVDQYIWDIAHENEVLTDEQYKHLQKIVESQYEPVHVGYVRALMRKGASHLVLSKYPEPQELPPSTNYTGGGP